MIALTLPTLRRILNVIIAANARADKAERERDDLRAAYEALKRENISQATNLDTWNVIYAGDKLAEQAEGR